MKLKLKNCIGGALLVWILSVVFMIVSGKLEAATWQAFVIASGIWLGIDLIVAFSVYLLFRD